VPPQISENLTISVYMWGLRFVPPQMSENLIFYILIHATPENRSKRDSGV